MHEALNRLYTFYNVIYANIDVYISYIPEK